MSRLACKDCGGWLPAASVATHGDAWRASHDHPAGAPVVVRWPGSDAERDAYDAAVAGRDCRGFAPVGGRLLVCHVASGGQVARLIARSPSDL